MLGRIVELASDGRRISVERGFLIIEGEAGGGPRAARRHRGGDWFRSSSESGEAQPQQLRRRSARNEVLAVKAARPNRNGFFFGSAGT